MIQEDFFYYSQVHNAASHLFVNFVLNIKICVLKHFVLSNKVDLSQVISVLISKKRASWKLLYSLLSVRMQAWKDAVWNYLDSIQWVN